jgi:hypothetical protein
MSLPELQLPVCTGTLRLPVFSGSVTTSRAAALFTTRAVPPPRVCSYYPRRDSEGTVTLLSATVTLNVMILLDASGVGAPDLPAPCHSGGLNDVNGVHRDRDIGSRPGRL